MIPQILQNDNFRFVLIRPKDKIPFEKDWQNTANYKFNDEKLLNHIKNDGNYGCATGYGNVICIDFDSEKVQNEITPKLPETFTSMSGGGLLHKWYIVDEPETIKILDDENNTLVDIQGKGKQIIAPGSTHPNGNKYVVIEDKPIAKTTIAEIKAIFGGYIKPKTEKIYSSDYQKDNLIQQIKSQIKVSDLLSKYGCSTNKNPTECPFHSSKGGKCLSFKNDVWHCFHCDRSGDIFHLYMEKEGVDFIHAKQQLAEKCGIKLDKQPVGQSVIMHLASRKREKATELTVQEFLKNEKIYTTRDDEKSECWIYKEGIYIPQGRTYIKEFCREILGTVYTTHFANDVIAKIEIDTYIDQAKFFEEEPQHLIAVNNGIYDLKENKIIPFSNKYKFFNKLNIDYIPGLDCPNIKKFFDSLFKDKQEIEVIQEIFGFLLYREYFLEKAFMFLGYGRNGKGKTLELMKHFIGVESCAEITLEDMEKDLFAVGELFKKKANLCGDLSKTALKHTGTFKKLVARDLVSAPRKFKTRVSFVSYAKMIFACNEIPITYDTSDAFMNRWIILNFPYTFLPQKEIDELKENEKENIKLRDPNIVEKLIKPEEMSGLLNWAIEGLKRLTSNKSFSYSPSTKEVKDIWLRRSDSCLAFIMDCIEPDIESYVTKPDFRTRYMEYCKKHKIIMSGDKVIKHLLATMVGATDDRKRDDMDILKHVWSGIRFKSKNDKQQHIVSNDDKAPYIVPEEEVVQ